MTVPPAVLTEREDRWILPYRGLMVSQVQVDVAFGLILNDGAIVFRAEIRLWVRC